MITPTAMTIKQGLTKYLPLNLTGLSLSHRPFFPKEVIENKRHNNEEDGNDLRSI
jgi:hypothetical protein